MTVEVVAATRKGAEFEAAKILEQWFKSFIAPDDKVIIVVGGKAEGERVEDIDLIVIGKCAPGRILQESSIPEGLRGRPFELRDFVFTIEVKSHDPSNVRVVSGNNIQVRYDRWKSATDQANAQKFALKNWVERWLRITCPRISHAVWLMNVPGADLEPPPRHVLFSDSDITRLFGMLDAGMFEYAAQAEGSTAIVSSIVGSNQGTIADIQDFFEKQVHLGSLDRRKIERICERLLTDQAYTERLGEQLLVFRGRGGAGKTLRLLNLARHLHHERGCKVLFLTFNKALVQDVRRLVNVLGLHDEQVRIQTTDSFMLKLCEALKLTPTGGGDRFWQSFAEGKIEAARQLASLSPQEIKGSPNARAFPDVFGWDFVLIDEGQDWPATDKSLILSLFGHKRVVVADGVDQFVQSVSHCDWTSGIPTSERQIVPLRKSLRLKANLCRFAMAFADEMQLPNWSIDLDPDLSGGRVKIFFRPYSRDDHELLFAEHARAGNRPIDSLFCVSRSRGSTHAALPADLLSWGEKVWDGTDAQTRNRLPDDLGQYRIVQYQSCRGLEGWTVVCLDLDRFYDEQLNHAPKPQSGDLFVDADTLARQHAARWCLIPFTRAIDTLVLHASEQSTLGNRLLAIARNYSDFVEIIR